MITDRIVITNKIVWVVKVHMLKPLLVCLECKALVIMCPYVNQYKHNDIVCVHDHARLALQQRITHVHKSLTNTFLAPGTGIPRASDRDCLTSTPCFARTPIARGGRHAGRCDHRSCGGCRAAGGGRGRRGCPDICLGEEVLNMKKAIHWFKVLNATEFIAIQRFTADTKSYFK